MRRTWLNEQKEKDVREAYEKALLSFGDRAPFMRKSEIIEEAMKFTAPRFYISYEEARRILSKMTEGGSVDIRRKGKRKMYEDLMNKLPPRGGGGKISRAMLRKAVSSEAPGFYIGKKRFAGIINKRSCT